MISSDFRAEARRKLDGKWGKVVLSVLAYLAIFILLGFIKGLFDENSFMNSLISLGTTVIEIPATFGLVISLLKVYKGENSDAFDFLSLGFSNFGKSWGITFNVILKLIVPIILSIVASAMMLYAFFSTFAVSVLSLPVTSISSSFTLSAVTGANMVLLVVGFIIFVVAQILLSAQSYYYKLAYVLAADNSSLTSKDAVEKSKELMTGKRGKLFCLELSFIGWAILASLAFGIGYLWLLPYIQFATFAFYFFVSGKTEATK